VLLHGLVVLGDGLIGASCTSGEAEQKGCAKSDPEPHGTLLVHHPFLTHKPETGLAHPLHGVVTAMKQAQHRLLVPTNGPALIEITEEVCAWVAAQGISTGLLVLWCPHTSASLTVQENADPAVRADILRFFADLAPPDPHRYAHDSEGPDDMPAHLRAMLTGPSLSIPVSGGRPLLGTWQGIYLFEHRRRPQRRTVILHLLGEGEGAASHCVSS